MKPKDQTPLKLVTGAPLPQLFLLSLNQQIMKKAASEEQNVVIKRQYEQRAAKFARKAFDLSKSVKAYRVVGGKAGEAEAKSASCHFTLQREGSEWVLKALESPKSGATVGKAARAGRKSPGKHAGRSAKSASSHSSATTKGKKQTAAGRKVSAKGTGKSATSKAATGKGAKGGRGRGEGHGLRG